MDYIREELLRQQAALTALLLGKAAEEEIARDEETAGGERPGEVSARKSPAAAGGERMVTEVLWAGTGGMPDAKVLSRTFQRDARRYDGGFRLY